MSSLQEIQEARFRKLKLLEDTFGDVFPSRTTQTHTLGDIQKKFPQFLRSGKKITTVGRARSIRSHGGSTFFDLCDEEVFLQGYLKKEEVAEDVYQLFLDAIDVGDFIEVSGRAYTTKRREKSLLISSWKPLAKALRPLPEKWHGLQSIEERYRKRSLDLLSHEETKKIFLIRSKMITFLRAYLDRYGFLEVETPILQPLVGGATARPFITHHTALDLDLYLRIAPELYLKRLLVGDYKKVYELGRNFRNEGIDATHNPEFTMLEAYCAYEDYKGLSSFIETLVVKLVRALKGKKKFMYQGETIMLETPFRRMTFYESIKRHALLPAVEQMDRSEIVIAAKRFGIEVSDEKNKAMILEDIFRKIVKPRFIQPTFVFDWPADLLPLAKRSSSDPEIAESFQLYIGGIELVKAFSELNNPIDQRKRFEEQERLRTMGNEEISPSDEDFIECMEYGMPPAAGFGIGIDRLALLFTDTHNIREVIFFPILKPK